MASGCFDYCYAVLCFVNSRYRKHRASRNASGSCLAARCADAMDGMLKSSDQPELCVVRPAVPHSLQRLAWCYGQNLCWLHCLVVQETRILWPLLSQGKVLTSKQYTGQHRCAVRIRLSVQWNRMCCLCLSFSLLSQHKDLVDNIQLRICNSSSFYMFNIAWTRLCRCRVCSCTNTWTNGTKCPKRYAGEIL